MEDKEDVVENDSQTPNIKDTNTDINTNEIDDFAELNEEKEIETAKFIMPSMDNENQLDEKSDVENDEDVPTSIEEEKVVGVTSEALKEEKEKLIHNENDIKIEGYNTEVGLNSSIDNKIEFVGEGKVHGGDDINEDDYEGNVVVQVTNQELIEQKNKLVHNENDIKIETYNDESEEEENQNNSTDTSLSISQNTLGETSQNTLGNSFDSDSEDI